MRCFSKLCAVLVVAGNAFCIPPLSATESKTIWPEDYERELNKWQEVIPGEPLDKNDSFVWDFERTRPPFPGLGWLVYSKGGKIVAEATTAEKGEPSPSPAFKPRWRNGETPSYLWNALPVDDGWIIAFDTGEFGAEVFWFNKDGSKRYEVAQEYIQVFLVAPDGIFGQGGLSHMGMSSGALSRLDKKKGKWQLTHLFDTPAYAPIQWLGDHNLVIVQDERALPVYLVGPYPTRDWGTRSLPFGDRVRLDEAKLYASGRYAFSETKLYTGGFPYVTELDLHTSKVRFLIPDSRFLNDGLRRAILEATKK